jgi:hypothetical protein
MERRLLLFYEKNGAPTQRGTNAGASPQRPATVMGYNHTTAVAIKPDLLLDQAVAVYMAYQPGSLCIHAMTVGLSAFHLTR